MHQGQYPYSRILSLQWDTNLAIWVVFGAADVGDEEAAIGSVFGMEGEAEEARLRGTQEHTVREVEEGVKYLRGHVAQGFGESGDVDGPSLHRDHHLVGVRRARLHPEARCGHQSPRISHTLQVMTGWSKLAAQHKKTEESPVQIVHDRPRWLQPRRSFWMCQKGLHGIVAYRCWTLAPGK